MKKLKIYALLLVPLLAFSELNIEKVNGVLSSIKSHNKSLTYYTTDKNFLNKLKVAKSNSLNRADILLFPKNKKVRKPIIVNSYNALKNNKKSIGAIYVKKGRTQIMFVDERLKARGLKLAPKYNRYIIKESYLCPLCLLTK
ncbi:MAG: hypothetical protein GXO60_01860 [Epsilonproteobacteria bacterium]|nr:hypothetical protein [Campylobacterota bacterium]